MEWGMKTSWNLVARADRGHPVGLDACLPAAAGGSPIRPADNFLVFGQPLLGAAEHNAVVACLSSRWIGTGPRVRDFETAFAAYRGAAHAVAVSSCTAALHLAMLAIGVGQGDEVITTAMTFCASVNAIVHTGATPVLADCDGTTMNLTPESIAAKITGRTRAILVVHLCGLPCDMPAIMALARQHGLRVIEDCAHAIETRIDGKAVGTFGDAGCFSFYATKNITTGEGGMVITDDAALADRVRVLSLHGMSKDAWRRFGDTGYRHYEVVASGFKNNMTDLQAALGLIQLSQIDAFAARRQAIWAMYDAAFADLPCQLPVAPAANVDHARHLYTPLLRLEQLQIDRDGVLAALTQENIGVGVHYQSISHYAYYRDTFGWTQSDFPNAEYIGVRTLSLPLSPALTDDDVDDVCTAFGRILTHYSLKDGDYQRSPSITLV